MSDDLKIHPDAYALVVAPVGKNQVTFKCPPEGWPRVDILYGHSVLESPRDAFFRVLNLQVERFTGETE